jgi:hypothetical protein
MVALPVNRMRRTGRGMSQSGASLVSSSVTVSAVIVRPVERSTGR